MTNVIQVESCSQEKTAEEVERDPACCSGVHAEENVDMSPAPEDLVRQQEECNAPD